MFLPYEGSSPKPIYKWVWLTDEKKCYRCKDCGWKGRLGNGIGNAEKHFNKKQKRLDLNKLFDQRRTTIASQQTLQTSIAASQTKKFVHTSVKYKRFVFQLAL